LKQIGLALHSYHDIYGAFPPAVDGREVPPYYLNTVIPPADRSQYIPGYHPWWSWIARMLPYYEQENLYRVADEWAHSRDRAKPEHSRWTPLATPPTPAVGSPLKVLQCPADTRTELATMVPTWPGAPQSSFRIALTGYLGVSGTNNRTFDGILIPNGSYKRNS